jgi:hypothetical protein
VAATVDLNFELARTWSLLGERERAIQHLEAAFAAGFSDTYIVTIDPALALLREDPVIEKLAPRGAGPGS